MGRSAFLIIYGGHLCLRAGVDPSSASKPDCLLVSCFLNVQSTNANVNTHAGVIPKYTDETATLLAGELLNGTSAHTIVAFISTPSVFVAAKNLVAEKPASERPTLYLLEFDERFRVFPEFVYYDYRRPFKLPRNNHTPTSSPWVCAKLTSFTSLQLL